MQSFKAQETVIKKKKQVQQGNWVEDTDWKKVYMKNEDVTTTTIWRIAEFSDILCMLSPGELYYESLKFWFYLYFLQWI